MNFIREERENIIKNNNTAQEILINHLEKMEPSATEIIIFDVLHGNLDFSILNQKGFKNVKTIALKTKGEVVSISNLPNGIEKLAVGNQLLIELENLPKSLLELDCQYNYIVQLDVSQLNKLRVLNLSNNSVKVLENLPDSLEELYCNNNHISLLNLRDLLILRVLHISNNKAVIIENLPPSIVDFKSDNNPYLEIKYANLHSSGDGQDNDETKEEADQEKLNYIESILDYYKLKKKYDENLFRDRKNAYKNAPTKKIGKKKAAMVIPKCIQCKQPGGTIFSRKSQMIYATCGNRRSPCNLQIEIFHGKYFSVDELIKTFGSEDLAVLKTNIICQKMDNIFHYDNENVALNKFKENLEEFTFMNDEYNELLGKNDALIKDEVRSEMALRKLRQIYSLIASIKELMEQYKKDGNKHLLKSAVEIQVNELEPEIRNLRMLRFEIMEMELKKAKKNPFASGGDEEGGDDDDQVVFNQSNLFQRYASLQKMQVLMGKPENVVKYRKTV